MSRESKGQGEMETRKEEDDAYIFTLFCHYSLLGNFTLSIQ